jgi:hypothetical protein
MSGSFWLFRVILVVTGSLFRNSEAVSLLPSIWLSAQLGIPIAQLSARFPGEDLRRRQRAG